jgi:hypothetical protein
MKSLPLVVLVAVLALVAQPADAETINFNFASNSNASILFTGTGNKIEFPSGAGYDFTIMAPGSGLGGYQGNIDGAFTLVEPISSSGGLEQATVSGTGAFSIYDGVAKTLTASLDLKDISVYSSLFGFTNSAAAVNLTSLQYAGDDPILKNIAKGSNPTMILTFQFPPFQGKSLTQLMIDGNVNSTSYSGSVSVVPEPSAFVLLGTGLVGLLVWWRRRS